VIVVVVEDTAKANKVVGGARLHIASAKNELPMETAIAKVDPNVRDMVNKYQPEGVAEVCGLWNSADIAGLGIGSNILVRACIALTDQIGLKTLVALVAKHTYRRATHKGFEVIDDLGDNGQFNYPKLDLVATAIVLKNLEDLPIAQEQERELILNMRNNINFVSREKWPKGEFELEYNLNLNILDNVK
jgi:hypothetical protein